MDRHLLSNAPWFSAFSCLLLNAIASVTADAAAAAAAVTELRPSQTVRLPVSEANDIRFTRLSRTQGLSQQRVTHIVQDAQGFMWFGTQYGLNRYDGYRFRVFKHDPKDPGSLCGVFIYSLFKDREGRLWTGCDYSLDRYDPETESFVHYRLDDQLPLNSASRVRHISEDDAGHLWLSTANGLYRLNPRTSEVTRFRHSDDDRASLGSNDVTYSGHDRRGNFWVGTALGLERLDPATGRVDLRLPIFEPRDIGFYEDRLGVFWIHYTSGNGLAIYDAQTQTLTPYSFKSSEVAGSPISGVSSMIEDDSGTLWIGTFSDGLLRFDREQQRFVRYRYDPPDRFSLPENRVTTLTKDREGNIWVGLGAIEPVLFGRQQFTSLPFDAYHAANLGERLVNSIHQDPDEVLWVGTTGALNRIDRETGTTQRFEVPGKGTTSDVLSIARDRSGALWVGTSGRGLYRLDPSTGALKGYRHAQGDPTSLSNDTVLDIWGGNAGELWVATFDGLNRLDLATGKFSAYRHTTDGRQAIYASILQDSAQQRFWLAAYGFGIVRFDPVTREFEVFGNAEAPDKRLSDNRINSIAMDSEGVVWAATQNGLNRLDPTSGIVKAYFEQDGLASNAVSCILEHSSGELWAGTSNGLSRLGRDGSFRNYTQADGLPGPDLTGWSACFRGPRGEMFFGGFSGAVAFMPENVSESRFVPPIVLTEFHLHGAPVSMGEGSRLSRSIAHTESLALAYNEGTVAFEFAALSFRSSETNRYRYMLEGLETDWQYVGSDRRFASYTTLSPGTYRFRVQGATSRGEWSEPGLSLELAILPPWWGTWWFRAAALLCLMAIAWSAHRYRIRQIGYRFEIELDARLSERTRIARELHDSLLQGFQGMMVTLQAVRNMLPRDPDRAALALEGAMDRGDQAIAEGRDAVHSLRSAAVGTDLAEAVASLRAELESIPNRRPPAYRVIVTGQPKALHVPIRDEVFRIVREAFRNAVKHADASRIDAEIEYSHTKLRLRIRDDGIGIDSETLAKGQRDGHWGLPGMRERAAVLSGSLTVRSKRGSGTVIELQIPADVAYAKNAVQLATTTSDPQE